MTTGEADQKVFLDAPASAAVSPITRRILAINMAALLIPIAGLLYLGPYRDGLIDSELEALRLQAETFAGAIGEEPLKPQRAAANSSVFRSRDRSFGD